MTAECEFGCDCDIPSEIGNFKVVLDQTDLDRLVNEKLARARRWVELQDKLGGQFETD
jgi:hypothetical protein